MAALFTAPTALRAVSRDDPAAELMRSHNLKSLRAVFLAGERSEPNIIKNYQALLEELGAKGAIVDDKWVPFPPCFIKVLTIVVSVVFLVIGFVFLRLCFARQLF